MAKVKTLEEIELLRGANEIVGKTLCELSKHVRDGISTLELDTLAEELIRSEAAIPAFKGYGGFPGTLCTSINDVVVHGIPSKKSILKDGDIVSIDCGAIKNGYVGDSAFTFVVGEVDEKIQNLLTVTKEALFKGIEAARVGNRIGDIGYAVQEHCEKYGYGVVREMVGHGIGQNMHEPPQVPNFGRRGTGPKIVEGMVICIEPMITLGTHEITIDRDGWTCRTRDGKMAAHFEHCIAIVDGAAKILSRGGHWGTNPAQGGLL